jgi:hypothetical protein
MAVILRSSIVDTSDNNFLNYMHLLFKKCKASISSEMKTQLIMPEKAEIVRNESVKT